MTRWAAPPDTSELHPALEARRDKVVGVRELEAHAEGPARGIEDGVDDDHLREVLAADRVLGDDAALHADRDLTEQARGGEDLDVERVDLGELEDLGRVAVLAGGEDAAHDDALDGAAQG